MSTVASSEASTRLPSLLERVSRGERITITEHGVPVAMLVPVDQNSRRDLKQVIEEIKEFGRGRRLPPGVTVRDLIEEGRRF